MVYYIELIEADQQQINKLIDQIPEVMKTAFVSTADRIRKEGIEKGIEKNKLQATRNMLKEGLNISFICKILEVSVDYVEKVQKEMMK